MQATFKPLPVADEEIMFSNTDLHGKDYHLVAANLKNLVELDKKLSESGIDRNIPTIFLAECVLVYIEKQETDSLLKWIADKFKTVFFVNYEQVCIIHYMYHVINPLSVCLFFVLYCSCVSLKKLDR